MVVKKGAQAWNLVWEMRPVLIAAEKIWRDMGHELVVTSGRDGERSANSLHWFGCAVDFRTWNHFWGGQWDSTKRGMAVMRLREALGQDYDVVSESDHIHVEYDPK